MNVWIVLYWTKVRPNNRWIDSVWDTEKRARERAEKLSLMPWDWEASVEEKRVLNNGETGEVEE
jgi:hypothetical protein